MSETQQPDPSELDERIASEEEFDKLSRLEKKTGTLTQDELDEILRQAHREILERARAADRKVEASQNSFANQVKRIFGKAFFGNKS